MITRISDWGGCTPLAGENIYSRNPLTGSYPGGFKESGVCTLELQGICNKMEYVPQASYGVCTLELQGICNRLKWARKETIGVSTSELKGICNRRWDVRLSSLHLH